MCVRLLKALALASCIVLTSCLASSSVIESTDCAESNLNTSLLGFYHPRVCELASESWIIEDIERGYFNETSLVALVLKTREGLYSPGFGYRLLIFQVDAEAAVLLWESDVEGVIFLDAEHLSFPRTTGFEVELRRGFQDRNGNGLPDLAFRVSTGGNCSDCSWISLLELTEDGDIQNIVPELWVDGFVEVNGDNQLELVKADFYDWGFGCTAHPCSPFELRFYGWDGKAYVDISPELSEYYDEQIAQEWSAITKTYNQQFACTLVGPHLAQILFHYNSTGRLSEGWNEIQSTVGNFDKWDLERSDPSQVEKCLKVMQDLSDYVESNRDSP